jgi:hypothetical protein
MPQSSASGAFTRSAVDAIPGIATGVGGAMATRAALLRYAPQIFKTARLSSPAGIASLVAEPLVGAAAGALGDWSVRRTLGPPSSWGYTGDQVERLRQARLQQEADMQQHPVASIGGGLVPQLAMGRIGFNPELKGALGALTGVSSRAAQTTLSLAEKRALAHAAINPAIVAGMSVGSPMLQGEDIDWRQVLPQLALATVQQGGSWFEGKPATPPRVKGPGTLEEYVAGGGQDPEMIRQLSSSTGTKNKYKAPQPNKVGSIADNAPESGGSQEQDSWLNTYNQASDIIENQEALAQAMAAIQESIKSGDYLSPENVERRLAQQAAMDTIAEFRGAKITGVKDIKDKFGNTKRGAAYSRQNIEDTARIEANINREDQTTRPHETMHVQLENMLKFGSAREKKIAERMLRAFNGDEEALVQTAAENASKRDLGAGPRNIKSLGETPVWDNVRRRWRFFRDTATPEDYAIGLSDRTLNDPHFNERRAMLNPSRATVAGAPKYQDDENQYIEGTSRDYPREHSQGLHNWLIDPEKYPKPAAPPYEITSHESVVGYNQQNN